MTTIINENSASCLKVDTDKNILYIIPKKIEYCNKRLFYEFIDYIVKFWDLAKANNMKYHIVLDLTKSEIPDLPPLSYYHHIKNKFNSLSPIFETNLHSTGVLCYKNGKAKMMLGLIFFFYKPTRPIRITEKEDEMVNFMQNNLL